MATYKLIQDIEAEDKILGPLTLRQFIFALIAVFLLYICFILVTRQLAFLLVVFLPPALFFLFFALPFGRDQPTELWALAKLRFWFKPRRRVWNQSGVKELVTITVPKKVERVLTNGLSETEVKSRLKALADTIDSRGWAVKHVGSDADAYAQTVIGTGSDRLIDIDSLPQEVPNDSTAPSDDMLDEVNNPIARQFETMIDQSSRNHRQQLMTELNEIREDQPVSQAEPPANNWFMDQAQTASPVPVIAAPTGASDDKALSANLAAQASSHHVSLNNLRTVKPLAAQAQAMPADTVAASDSSAANSPANPTPTAQAAAMTTPSDPAIISLAKNDDLNVATLAREAQKTQQDVNQSSDEVIVSLH